MPCLQRQQLSGGEKKEEKKRERSMEISTFFSLLSPFSLLLLFSSTASSKGVTDNPADQLVAAINTNRTNHKSSTLFPNPGLGCIALEYIKAYTGQCDKVGQGMRPPNSNFVDTFAPNCGIDAKTLSPITGRLLVCQSKYVPPDQAFDLLVRNDQSLKILYDKNHTEVGAAVKGTDGGAPYFWSVLFSGGKTNGSFVFSDGGTPKPDRPGCYSGAHDECSGTVGRRRGNGWLGVASGVLIALASIF